MLYYVVYDNSKLIDNKLINSKNIIFIEKKYDNPIKMLLLILKRLKLKSDDIICFIGQSNTIIVDNEDNIIKKFNEAVLEYNNNIKSDMVLFSRLKRPSNIYEKYNQDKLFPRFGKYHIDTRLFIGSVKSLINFWSAYESTNMKSNNSKESYN